MIDRERLLGYRIWVVRGGLALSWLLLAIALWEMRNDPGLSDRAALTITASSGGGLLVLSMLPWRRLLLTRIGDLLVTMWTVLAVVALLGYTVITENDPVAAAFLAVIVFASATLISPVPLLAVGLASGVAYGISLDQLAVDLTSAPVVTQLVAFGLAAVFAMIAAVGVRRGFRSAAQQLERADEAGRRLEQRRRQVDELYAVSRTIGAGSNLAEVLPELVGLVVAAVGARIGLVFLYHVEDEALELVSPVWVAGHAVRAEGYRLPLTEPGLVQRVFISGEPTVHNELETLGPADALLSDLETSRVAAVAMRIETRPIGVLLVADKMDGDFTKADAERLEALAGPSALVLNQMSRYEAAREAGQKMAELAQLKTDFVSVVSHELRTPLTSIIGALSTLQRPGLDPSSTAARDLVETAERQANRLRALIEDLLTVSRIDNRALPVRPEPTVLETLIDEVVTALPGALGNVTVDVAIETPIVEIDPDHLRRIVANLVENALKYAPGSPVDVHVWPVEDDVWISVVDHGPGIPYELHDHIFQRFTQVGRHETHSSGGTGLGLSIVRGLTEAMGGRVWFEPSVGGGATFTVTFPKTAGARLPTG